jgi:hypothetical protein
LGFLNNFWGKRKQVLEHYFLTNPSYMVVGPGSHFPLTRAPLFFSMFTHSKIDLIIYSVRLGSFELSAWNFWPALEPSRGWVWLGSIVCVFFGGLGQGFSGVG